MAVQASWHTFSWGYGPSRVISVESLSTGRSVSVERNADREGEPATQTVALELVTLSFDYMLVAAAGCDPRREYEEINECLGVHAPLYLAGAKFLAFQMMLKSVAASDWVLDGQGRALSVKVSVSFEEYAEDASGMKRQKIEKDVLRPGVQTKPAATSALRVGATGAQKAAKATRNRQMARW